MADLPVLPFIQERLAEADSTLNTRKGTAFYDLFIKPQQFMLQPLITAMETVLTAQSVNLILSLASPDTFATNLVDNLVSNVFVTRNTGELALGTVQVLYQTAIALEYPALTAEFQSDSLSFFNSEDVVITAAQMELQTSGNFFYVNFPIQAQLPGDAYNLTIDQGVTFINDSNAISTSFTVAPVDGLASETNTQVLNRASNSIGVRDLETVKGINAIIQENFTDINQIVAIGMGDPEMQRDILYNAHVGGKTDIYVNNSNISTSSTNFIGVEYDSTRSVPSNVYVQMGTLASPTNLGTPNVVSGSVEVTSNQAQTAAIVLTVGIPGSTGINFGNPSYLATYGSGSSTLTVGAQIKAFSTQSGSTTIAVVSGTTAGFFAGQIVTGTGISGSTTYVQTILSTTQLQISVAATGTHASTSLTFAGTTYNFRAGQTVSGADIPAGATITNVLSSSTISISPAMTLNARTNTAGATIAIGGIWYINLQVDDSTAVDIKISGAEPSETQQFEIINAINAAVGEAVASPYNNSSQILLESQTIGAGSQFIFSKPSVSTKPDGTLLLIPTAAGSYTGATPTATYSGIADTVYVEGTDYSVDYSQGTIWQLTGGGILSGQTIAAHPGSPDAGAGTITNGDATLTGGSGNFSKVAVGDYLYIDVTTATGITEGVPYIVKSIDATDTILTLLDFNPTSSDSAVQYHVVSQQVVIVDYDYNPISIDIGPNVLLADGLSRGIRPGRQDYTITEVAFLGLVSIQEIDPISQQGLGVFLNAPTGFGGGGFGDGGFGTAGGGDYQFIVNDPTTRFSAFEDSMILFNNQFFGQSFQITYYAVDEIAALHTFCRNDGERVCGADVLPKNFCPGFVNTTINYRVNATNPNTPSATTLTAVVNSYINSVIVGQPVDESVIVEQLIDQGLASIQTPFTMTGTVFNTDGSTTIVTSTDELSYPAVTLQSQAANYTTSRIVKWYGLPTNVTLTQVN